MMPVPAIFHVETSGRTIVVVPQQNIGSLADEQVQPELQAILQQLAQPDLANLVIDFEKVDYFGSSMLEAMLKLWKTVDAAGGKTAICNLSRVGLEVLQIGRFDTLWTILPSREEALRWVGEESPHPKAAN